MSETKENNCGDTLRLESKVVYAISRLQNQKTKKGKQRKINGVTKKQVVDYLSKNYKYLDGDIESQVTTALLSGIRNGVICLLKDGKYRLVGPNSKFMISNCMTRTPHGSNCKCPNVINVMSKIYPNTCCSFRIKKRSPQADITKMLKKPQRKRSRSRKKYRSKPTQVRDPRAERSSCSSRSMEFMDMDFKTPDFSSKCYHCLQKDAMGAGDRLRKNVSPSLLRKFVAPKSDKLPVIENIK